MEQGQMAKDRQQDAVAVLVEKIILRKIPVNVA
jgi:hypothetical protein